jgi:cobalamin biosynthesis Mg chelatase CobN
MSLFRRRFDPVTVTHVIPPAEAVDDEQRIARLHADIYQAYRDGDLDAVDRLIDLCLAIRPAEEAS